MPIRVLVVDDSALMRSIIVNIISADSEVAIVGIARNGLEAIEKTKLLSPDVVTLDIEMPKLNGLEALKYIMKEHPTRVLMVGSASSPEVVCEAISQGAAGFIANSSHILLKDSEEFAAELVDKIKAVAAVNLSKQSASSDAPIPQRADQTQLPDCREALFMNKVVAMGASTGGLDALEVVLKSLPKGLPASVLIVQHLPPGFSRSFVERIGQLSNMIVKEAEDGDVISPGVAFIAPGGFHMVVGKESGKPIIILEEGPKLWGVKPSVDKLMVSVAKRFKSRSIGVLLSGMGVDGANGMQLIKRWRGQTIVQDEETSIVFGMPKAALEKGCVDEVLPITGIAKALIHICAGEGAQDELRRLSLS
ncbi:MAG: chemotaxis response regulator protein-glutamate methylesterase [Actinobacteria bacterium]|nr:chemotaxis response regulator protein-glutamate methylesterase [Actinomycetota bacterium]